MSNRAKLAARISRAIAGVPYAISVDVIDATGTQTEVGTPAIFPGRPVDLRSVRAILSRVAEVAHAGAVLEVTLPDNGDRMTLTAPGGAFDDRQATPPAAMRPTDPTAPSADARAFPVGTRLPTPCRAVFIVAGGDIELRTEGSPDGFQAPFPVPAGLTLPIEALELGPNTSATVWALF